MQKRNLWTRLRSLYRQPKRSSNAKASPDNEFQILRDIARNLDDAFTLYRSLVEYAPFGILVHDGVKIRYANPTAAQILGASGPIDLIDFPVLDLVGPEERVYKQARINRVLDKQEVADFVQREVHTLNGKKIAVALLEAPVDLQDVPHCQMIIVRDVKVSDFPVDH